MVGWGQAGLTAASTNISKPLDSDAVSHLNVRVLCSWSHFDDDTNTLVATDLKILLAPLCTMFIRPGSTNLADFGWEW